MKYSFEFVKDLVKNSYGFENISQITYFETGWENYSYYVEADGMKLVIQIMGGPANTKLLKNLNLQINVINYLKNAGFPYKIPYFIKNNKGKFLSKYKDRYFLVYDYIEGATADKFNLSMFKEYAKAVAVFTKYMQGFDVKNKKDSFHFSWLVKEFEKIGKFSPRNKLDEVVIDNVPFILGILQKVKDMDYGRLGVIHADINRTNVLFSGDNLVGIIDFHNVEISPIVKEVGVAISRNNFIEKGYTKEKEKIFLSEFERIFKLTEKERKAIIPLILRDSCAVVWWKYLHMEKNRNEAHLHIQRLIEDMHKLEKLI